MCNERVEGRRLIKQHIPTLGRYRTQRVLTRSRYLLGSTIVAIISFRFNSFRFILINERIDWQYTSQLETRNMQAKSEVLIY